MRAQLKLLFLVAFTLVALVNLTRAADDSNPANQDIDMLDTAGTKHHLYAGGFGYPSYGPRYRPFGSGYPFHHGYGFFG